MDKTVAAIELTSNQIKLVVGYELDGQIYVLYTLSKPIKDLIQNGKVVDQIALAKEISNIVDIYDGQAKLKIKIQEILLILPSSGLEIYQSNDTTTVLSEEHKVSHTDIVNLYTIIRNGKLPGNNILIDIVPNSFILGQFKNSEVMYKSLSNILEITILTKIFHILILMLHYILKII